MMPAIRRNLNGFLLSWLVLCSFALTVRAAERFQKGEKVEVFYLREWRLGEVVSSKSDAVQVQFVFGAGIQMRVFSPEEVRHEYEFGAIVRGRVWSDQSGSFKVKAALLAIQPDKVRLRTEEGKELEVDTNKLSDKDQSFLKEYRLRAGGGALMTAPLDPIEFDTAGAKQILSEWKRLPRFERKATASSFRLDADPARASLQMTQAGVALPRQDFHDFVSAIIPLGGNEKWLLAARDNVFGSQYQYPMRVDWASLASGKIGKQHAFPAGEIVLDYHAPSMQLLTYSTRGGSRLSEKESVLSLWTTSPVADEARAVQAWRGRLSTQTRVGHAAPWARIAGQNLVIQRDDDHNIIAWDTNRRRVVWTTSQESFWAPQPILSHGGKYLFIPEDYGLRILSPADGQELGRIETTDSCNSVALHPNGKTLAILSTWSSIVLDIDQPQSMRLQPLNSPASGIGGAAFWFDDQRLAVADTLLSFSLFDIDMGVMLWNYRFDFDTNVNRYEVSRSYSIVDKHLVYSAETGSDGPFIVGAVQLPGSEVDSRLAGVSRRDFYLLGEGTPMSIKVSTDQDTSRVRAAMEQQVRDNGWQLSDSAPYTLVASTYVGKTQSITYGSFLNNETRTVTFSPRICRYQILDGTMVLWENSSSTSAPPTVMTGAGESLDNVVNDYNEYHLEFFTDSDVPAEVIDPTKKLGLGRSTVTNRGLVLEANP